MHIFCASAKCFEPRRILFGTLGDFVKRRERLLHFRCSENADRFESLSPSAVDRDFVGQKAPVERKGALKRVELFVRRALETPAPQPVIFAFGHRSVLCVGAQHPPNQSRRFLPPSTPDFLFPPPALAFGRTVTGNPNKLMNPSASLGL